MTRRGERGIWQRRCWEHTIRDEREFRRAHGLHAFRPGPHPSLRRDPRVKPGEGGLGRERTRRTGRTRRFAGVSRVASIPPDDGRRRGSWRPAAAAEGRPGAPSFQFIV